MSSNDSGFVAFFTILGAIAAIASVVLSWYLWQIHLNNQQFKSELQPIYYTDFRGSNSQICDENGAGWDGYYCFG